MRTFKYFVLILFIASCNTPKAVIDYDESFQFSEVNTYQIYPDLVTNLNQLDEQRVISILTEELAEEGFTTSNDPQVFVNFYATEYETASGNSLGVGVGGGGGNMGVGVSGGIPLGGPDNYLRLTIDFINASEDALIWQAEVDAKFNRNASPQKREARLRAMIEKALKKYPPN